ncbi:hypothetical protein LTR66_001019 [Elasticomyces elasticus]|nr:hypothetical protein LTR28_003881 [Elasticomyces elasticus]KAK5000072.1 hypothetical protein LTR66_001019 [Elasticomyces elasticus]
MPGVAGSGDCVAKLFRDPHKSSVQDVKDEEAIYGGNADIMAQVRVLQMKYFFAENTSGVNDEARLCLRKPGTGLWGVCEDYELFVANLAKSEKRAMAADPTHASNEEEHSCRKLKIRAFFSESDVMIGKKGQEYFERCWTSSTEIREVVDFSSTTVKGTDHETIIELQDGPLQEIMKEVKQLGKA